jgi:hypothetical protein
LAASFCKAKKIFARKTQCLDRKVRSAQALLQETNILASKSFEKENNMLAFDLTFLILMRPNDGTFTSFLLPSKYFFCLANFFCLAKFFFA